ncbi:hypothetical protein [Amycolatopsis sp. NPDC052450]|uniref:hypothetical protein n=1 Tax=Amycolatopsis sp. NPDC052450 TaxID=3363937 RepID=UPI0037C81122
MDEQLERLLEERFARVAAARALRVPDPRRATQHFTALTILLASEALRLSSRVLEGSW